VTYINDLKQPITEWICFVLGFIDVSQITTAHTNAAKRSFFLHHDMNVGRSTETVGWLAGSVFRLGFVFDEM
jgi:hypothetical protein